MIGDGGAVPSDGEPVSKARAGYLLKKARVGYLRKSLPVQNVMAAGGWRDPSALPAACQGADSAMILLTDLAE